MTESQTEEFICSECGATVGETDKFCSNCGADQEAIDYVCSDCGAEVGADDRFCIQCGAELSDQDNDRGWLGKMSDGLKRAQQNKVVSAQ